VTVTTTKPTLFATPATVQALAGARCAVALVGSYDGSGNFGDIAQLEAALGAVGQLGDRLLALPVLERQLLASHRELAPGSGLNPPYALFFDPGEGLEDDLLPVAAPVDLGFGACYLYGGGYLNHRWGPRKLAMLRAAEALLASGGAEPICRLSSGLQVEAEWIAGLGEEECSALSRFDFLGARDSGSREALETLPSAAPAVETGDDAVGLLARLPERTEPAPSDARLLVNLHFADHGWVTEQADGALDFYVRLLAEFGRLGGRRLVARPLIAYLDGRIDEREALGRLREACAGVDVEFAEPLVLRPSVLDAAAAELRAADLTLSCSYHVALTSLMLEVPTLLLGDNAYYVQKAAGLSEDFGLPPAFTPSAAADPLQIAREIAGAVLDADAAAALHSRLAAGAERLRRRRARTEAELATRLGAAALAGLTDQVEALAERLRQRAAEPAELHAQLSALRTEQEELQRSGGRTLSPLEAEIRAQEAELRAEGADSRAQEAIAANAEAHATLAATLQSRSWRMAEPLRRIGRLLRRR
jgi:polysaccharide pyruvyl transferase WcaK-like protein